MKFLFLVALIFSNSKAQALDLSTVYNSHLKQALFSKSEISQLKKLKILIIPGVLAESFDSSSGNQIKVGFIFEKGFSEHIKLMQKNYISYEYLKFDTESASQVNAEAIITAIENSKLAVVIYSHSKGGLDTLEAFRQRPDLLSKVHGWVSVQSPFWGATVASNFYDNTITKLSGKSLFEWLGGSIDGMSALTIDERSEYMDSTEVRSLIGIINKKIKFLNYASYKPNTIGIDTPLELFRNITQAKTGDNDGVVPLTSALMSLHGLDINYAVEKNIDHLMTMTKYRPDKLDFLHWFRSDYDQQTHAMSLIKMVL